MKLISLSLFITFVIAAVFPLFVLGLRASEAGFQDILYCSLSLYIVTLAVLITVVTCLLLAALIRALFPRRRSSNNEETERFDPTIAILVFALVAVCNTGTLSRALEGFSLGLQDVVIGTTKMMDTTYLQNLVADSMRDFPENHDSLTVLAIAYLHTSGQLLGIYGRFLVSLVQIVMNSGLIPFYCWWLLLFLIGTLGTTTSSHRVSILPLVGTWLKSRNQAQRQRLLLAGVFLIGLYFSIAAIIAIPALQQNTLNTPITRDYVEKALQSVSTPKETLQARFPENYRKDSALLTGIAQTIQTLPAEIKTKADAVPLERRQAYIVFYEHRQKSAEEVVKNATRAREQLIINWNKLRNEVLNRNEGLVKSAINAFEVASLNPLSAPERVSYLQTVVSWFQYQQGYGENALRGTMQQIDEFDANLGYVFSDIQNAVFAVTPPDSSAYTPPTNDPIAVMNSRPFYPGRDYFIDQGSQMPNAPEPGSFAGVFGFISRWLLSTRSFSLALITGMIGFGLLGAAVTNYVRADIPNSDGQEIVAERVIIQGVSAAIVIFLTVHGGLAMLSGGEKEANGYVMCFACLIGAVFSEHVWLWAKGRLIEMLPNKAPPAPLLPAPTKPPSA